MKRKYSYFDGKKQAEREYSYIPFRYILAVLITLFEVLAVIGIVAALCFYVPYFYLAAWATEIFCVIHIIASDDNPDYKVPWLLFVLIIPIAGFMLYFMFYSRKLQKRFVKRLDTLKSQSYKHNDSELFSTLKKENPAVASQAKMLCSIGEANLFTDTKQEYFPLGEDMHQRLLQDLNTAEKFIYMEYFIIEEGKFWNSILEILKRKAAAGVEVKVLYDDIGCMMTLPGDYHKTLKAYGIEATPFSRLKGNVDSEFNNRSHRKITVIDGKIGYTGGVNIADEYINEIVKYGHWKDTAIRLEGKAVRELTKLFLVDFAINVRKMPNKLFGVDNPLYNVSEFEKTLYKKIKVRSWKDKVWELGGLSGFSKKKLASPSSPEYIEKFIIECNKGVLTHRLSYLIGFLSMLFIPNMCAFTIALPVAVVNLFLNILPTIILRYNTPKLIMMLIRMKKR